MKVRGVFFLLLLLTIGMLAMAIGPFVHESDQASLLIGGVRLAEGKDHAFAADFYNYDKQYVTYWLVALATRAFPHAEVVTLGNILGFAIFWGGMLIFLAASRVRAPMQAIALGACIVAPSFWVHSPFLATAFVAEGFLFLAMAAWRHGRGRTGFRLLAAILVALGVGSRADVVLVLPLAVWLVTPACSLRKLMAQKWAYMLIAAGFLALLVGRAIYTGSKVDFNAPFFYPKIFAVFVVFGLGASVLVAPVCLAAIAHYGYRRWSQGRGTWIFYGLGAAGLLLPFAYYSIQLFSPRYWVAGLSGLILFAASRRGRCLLAIPWRGVRIATAAGWAAAAVLPIFVGLRLGSLSQIHLVTETPTTFPTADGLMPMGALAWQNLQLRVVPGGALDHNQATWLAAKKTNFFTDAEGVVPLVPSPLRTILQLAVELQNKKSRTAVAEDPFAYTELRVLVRKQNAFSLDGSNADPILKNRGFWRVSPVESRSYEILCGQANTGNSPEVRRAVALAELFGWHEYSLYSEEPMSATRLKDRKLDGRTIALISSAPFEVSLSTRDGRTELLASKPVKELGEAVVLPGWKSSNTLSISPAAASVYCATSILPDFMNSGL